MEKHVAMIKLNSYPGIGIINWKLQKSPDVRVSSGAQIAVCDQKPNICWQILLNPYYLYIQTKLSLHSLCKICMMQNQTVKFHWNITERYRNNVSWTQNLIT